MCNASSFLILSTVFVYSHKVRNILCIVLNFNDANIPSRILNEVDQVLGSDRIYVKSLVSMMHGLSVLLSEEFNSPVSRFYNENYDKFFASFVYIVIFLNELSVTSGSIVFKYFEIYL